jgi:hypothetical protein
MGKNSIQNRLRIQNMKGQTGLTVHSNINTLTKMTVGTKSKAFVGSNSNNVTVL